MRVRTILTTTMIVAAATACGERSGHEQQAENEAVEAAPQQATASARIDAPAELVARTKIGQEAAKTAALAKVPGGRIASGELEEEDGKLIWSFDIKVAGKDGIDEVHVDALTGEVGAPEHESGAAEAAEEADEAGEEAESGQIQAPAELLARAKITEKAARAAALAKVPGGKIAAGELEEEDGKLIWSFDIKVAGKDGIEEVHVDAITGKVGAPEHESGGAEAGEKGDVGGA